MIEDLYIMGFFEGLNNLPKHSTNTHYFLGYLYGLLRRFDYGLLDATNSINNLTTSSR